MNENNFHDILKESKIKKVQSHNRVGKFTFADFTDDFDKTGKQWLKTLRKYISDNNKKGSKGTSKRYFECYNTLEFVAEDKQTFEPISFSDKKTWQSLF